MSFSCNLFIPPQFNTLVYNPLSMTIQKTLEFPVAGNAFDVYDDQGQLMSYDVSGQGVWSWELSECVQNVDICRCKSICVCVHMYV